jgi:hypothetical protein
MTPPQPEHPDRPFVRDIYAAQKRGFPIHDPQEYEIYRAALTSVEPLDDPATTAVLSIIADRARSWIEAHNELDAFLRLRESLPPG